MSLTSLLKQKKYRNAFAERFPVPICSLDGDLLAPPKTKRYSMIGTAFDYLLRFHLKRTNPDAESRQWVAESGLDELRLMSGGYGRRLSDGKAVKVDLNGSIKGILVPVDEDGKMVYRELGLAQAEERYAKTVADYERFLSDGNMNRGVMRGALFLAQLDPILRAGRVVFSDIDENDVDDLSNLLGVAKNIDSFTRRQRCTLNPVFGKASVMVGGADADFILGDTLIDIKTTKFLKLKQDMWSQVVGYYLLDMINGNGHGIKNLGIYFSRHGVLQTFSVDDLGDVGDFMDWFKEEVKKDKRR